MAPDALDKKVFASLLILLIIVMLEYPMQAILDGMPTVLLACSILFIAVALAYSFFIAHGKNANRKDSKVFDYAFYAFAGLALVFIIGSAFTFNIFLVFYLFLYNLLASFVIYIILFFLFTVGAYLIYTAKNYKAGGLVLCVALALLIIYFMSGYSKVYIANDESITMLYSVKDILYGMNPYTASVSKLLYFSHFENGTSFTLLSNNTFAGTMSYPSLFFLTFVPFYFLSPPTIQNLENTDLTAQSALFIFILMVVVYSMIEKKDIMKPRYMLYIFLALFLSNIISVTTYLMLAVILLAYWKLSSKYSWILLGIAVSLQEELWIPAALLIAYSFNTYGSKAGMKNLVGTAAVFLILNGYFILLNPGAYLHAVFEPINGFLPLDPSAPIGYFVFMHYGVATNLFSDLFMLATAGVILALLYFNVKKAIPLLSIIPFMFLTHALVNYYYFFMTMFVVIAYSEVEKHRDGFVARRTAKDTNFKYAIFSLFGIIVLLGIFLTLQAHAEYVNAVNISVSNQQAYISGNNLYYTGTISYNLTDANTSTMYVMLNVYGGGQSGFYGLFNTSILNNSKNCSYPCSVNINRIELNRSSTTYRINASAQNFSGDTYASVFLYNGEYAYQSGMIKAR